MKSKPPHSVELMRCANGVIVRPPHKPASDYMAPVSETLVFDEAEDFVAHIRQWWNDTEMD